MKLIVLTFLALIGFSFSIRSQNHERYKFENDSTYTSAGVYIGFAEKYNAPSHDALNSTGFPFSDGFFECIDSLHTGLRFLYGYPYAQCDYKFNMNEKLKQVATRIVKLSILGMNADMPGAIKLLKNQLQFEFRFSVKEWEADTLVWVAYPPAKIWEAAYNTEELGKRRPEFVKEFTNRKMAYLQSESNELVSLNKFGEELSYLPLWLPRSIMGQYWREHDFKSWRPYLEKEYGICFYQERRKVKFMRVDFY